MEFKVSKPRLKIKLNVAAPTFYKGGDAVAADMREGKTAYVQGELIEGTIPDNPITVFKFDNLNVFPLELSLKGTYNTTNLELSSTIPTNPTTSISIDEKTEFPLTIPTANTYNTRDLTITSSVVPTNPYEYFGKMCMQ